MGRIGSRDQWRPRPLDRRRLLSHPGRRGGPLPSSVSSSPAAAARTTRRPLLPRPPPRPRLLPSRSRAGRAGRDRGGTPTGGAHDDQLRARLGAEHEPHRLLRRGRARLLRGGGHPARHPPLQQRLTGHARRLGAGQLRDLVRYQHPVLGARRRADRFRDVDHPGTDRRARLPGRRRDREPGRPRRQDLCRLRCAVRGARSSSRSSRRTAAAGEFDTVTLNVFAYEAVLSGDADFAWAFVTWEGVDYALRGEAFGEIHFGDYGFPDWYEVVLMGNTEWMADEPRARERLRAGDDARLRGRDRRSGGTADILVEHNPDSLGESQELARASATLLAENYMLDADGNFGTQTLEKLDRLPTLPLRARPARRRKRRSRSQRSRTTASSSRTTTSRAASDSYRLAPSDCASPVSSRSRAFLLERCRACLQRPHRRPRSGRARRHLAALRRDERHPPHRPPAAVARLPRGLGVPGPALGQHEADAPGDGDRLLDQHRRRDDLRGGDRLLADDAACSLPCSRRDADHPARRPRAAHDPVVRVRAHAEDHPRRVDHLLPDHRRLGRRVRLGRARGNRPPAFDGGKPPAAVSQGSSPGGPPEILLGAPDRHRLQRHRCGLRRVRGRPQRAGNLHPPAAERLPNRSRPGGGRRRDRDQRRSLPAHLRRRAPGDPLVLRDAPGRLGAS